MKSLYDMAIEAGFDEDLLHTNKENSLAMKLALMVKEEVKNECLKVILDECTNSCSNVELTLQRMYERVSEALK